MFIERWQSGVQKQAPFLNMHESHLNIAQISEINICMVED